MAKKSRRARRGVAPVRPMPRASAGPAAEELEEEIIPAVRQAPRAPRPISPRVAPSSGRRPAALPEVPTDYSYVTRDLKRVGILALTAFGGLIVLSFLLH